MDFVEDEDYYYHMYDIMYFKNLYKEYKFRSEFSGLIAQNLLDLDSVLEYHLSRIFVWNDLEDMNLTRFNGSYLKIHSLESNRLVLESQGAVNSICRFRTDEENFTDR